MKRTWILFPLILPVFALIPARYSVSPQSPVLGSNLGGNTTSTAVSILIQAHRLLNAHGIRPQWPNLPFREGEDVSAEEAPAVLANLIPCESQGRSVKHLDSNHEFSYGVLQIQSSTWAQFEKGSGIIGSPMNPATAIDVGLWAVEHGYLSKWSCAKLTGLITT